MTDEDRAELRAMLVEVIGAATNALADQLGSQISEIHDELGSLADDIDVIEGDVAAVRRQMARVLREREQDRRHAVQLARRVNDLEQQRKG